MVSDLKWTADNIQDQGGKTVLVTGANSGLGLEICRVMASKGAQVIMACRNAEKASPALAEIRQLHPGADVKAMILDLAHQQSIREFWKRFRTENERLDILINNAGVLGPPFTRTIDGYELQMGTNHFGHFTLTGMLLEMILATPDSRIVTVSSSAHNMGRRDFSDPNYEKRRYNRFFAYAQSKLANLWFCYELQRRLVEAGHSTISVAAHPGYTATNLQRFTPFFKLLNPILAQKMDMGALPILYTACEDDVQGSDYFGPDGWREMRGYPRRIKSSKVSTDDDLARRFWVLSEDITGCMYVF